MIKETRKILRDVHKALNAHDFEYLPGAPISPPPISNQSFFEGVRRCKGCGLIEVKYPGTHWSTQPFPRDWAPGRIDGKKRISDKKWKSAVKRGYCFLAEHI